MKYIIFKDNDILKPIIFPDHINHSEIKLDNAHPVSAGFMSINSFGLIETHGRSESLNLGPMECDEDLLRYAISNSSNMSSFIRFHKK